MKLTHVELDFLSAWAREEWEPACYQLPAGIEDIIALPYRYLWTLELSGSPYPEGLQLPEVPRVFYGHHQASDADRI